MSVGFGFSVGDFLAALKLVGTVIDALRESSHATSSFRSLINELYALETVLIRVKRLDIDDRVRELSLQQAASQCQRTIDEFWKGMQKDQPHLQENGTNSRIKDGWVKIKWAVCKKKDVDEFRAQIQGHTSSIEMLLMAVLLEATTLNARKQASNGKSLVSTIQNLSLQVMGKLNVIGGNVEQCVQQGKSLIETTVQIFQTNLRVFQIVHDIQLFIRKIPGQIQRQQPVYLIDAFNKESPFHLEFVRSWEGLLAVLKDNIKAAGCDSGVIDRGEFVIEESGTLIPIDLVGPWNGSFFPGQRVAMSVKLQKTRKKETVGSSCPKCDKYHEESATKEIMCVRCGIVFRHIEEVIHDASVTNCAGGNLGPRRDEQEGQASMQKFRRIQLLLSNTSYYPHLRAIGAMVPNHMWICCKCGQGNLFSLCGDRCPICSHYVNYCCIGPGQLY